MGSVARQTKGSVWPKPMPFEDEGEWELSFNALMVKLKQIGILTNVTVYPPTHNSLKYFN